ncbi:hypothetical protein [Neogemmobacter tilapiae]|nr:hypothetical protein [Gemmobacter tilapiae]
MQAKVRDLADGRNLTLDPENLWRNNLLFAGRVADGLAAQDDPRVVLRGLGAADRASYLAAIADWASLCPVPEVRAAGRLYARALEEFVQHAVPLEKTLGLSPDQGQTAGIGVKLRERDGLLRRIGALQHFSGLPDRQAAREISSAFQRYLGVHVRETRPQGEPAASFWLLAQMRKTPDRPNGLATVVPQTDRLAQILSGKG